MDTKDIIKALRGVEIEPELNNILIIKNGLKAGHDLEDLLLDLKEWVEMDIKIF